MSSKGTNKDSILVVGVGNPLRSDDGAGSYVAESIEARGFNKVKVWVTQQLHVEDLESMLSFSKVILIDASTSGPVVDLRQVNGTDHSGLASSHHLSAQTLVNMASNVYHKELNMQLCSIRGSNFEAGDKISPEVLYCAQKAIELICSSIMES
ncbi:MAG: hydrogenase maturation protease [Candidatus Omnitrophica bacterium]|nr:hydrogenase maturation protease [Candidatus Omnitrophota bacterium]